MDWTDSFTGNCPAIFASLNVPQARSSVLATCCQKPTIWGKGNIGHPVFFMRDSKANCLGLNVPQDYSSVPIACCQKATHPGKRQY